MHAVLVTLDVPAPPRRERRARRDNLNTWDALPPDHPARLLARTGPSSVIYRAAYAALRARQARDADALLTLVPDDYTPRFGAEPTPEFLAGLLCAMFTTRAKTSATAATANANAREDLVLTAAVLLALLLDLATRSGLDPAARRPDAIPPDIPPPANIAALTTSTLTAAPPAPARPVPGARRAVLMTAG